MEGSERGSPAASLDAGLFSSQHCLGVGIHTAQMVTGFPSSGPFPNQFTVGERGIHPSLAWQAPHGPSAHLK